MLSNSNNTPQSSGVDTSPSDACSPSYGEESSFSLPKPNEYDNYEAVLRDIYRWNTLMKDLISLNGGRISDN